MNRYTNLSTLFANLVENMLSTITELTVSEIRIISLYQFLAVLVSGTGVPHRNKIMLIIFANSEVLLVTFSY